MNDASTPPQAPAPSPAAAPAPAPAPAHPPRKRLGGPMYQPFIRDFVARKPARNYLEVGVRDGGCLVNVDCPSIGVDPLFVFNRNPMGKKRVMHLYQMTSDEYFRDHDPRTIFGSAVDVAFLDGLHLFEYLLRDFINTERVCDRQSAIMLDDCLPVNIEMTERYHRRELRADKAIAGWWTGDVWKVVSILREYRPDLRIIPVNTEVTGNVVVCNLDPASTVLSDRYYEIVDRWVKEAFTPASFDDYWQVNAPVSAEKLLHGFDLSLMVRP